MSRASGAPLALAALLSLAGCASAPPPGATQVVYRIEARARSLEVEVQVEGPAPARWYLLGEGGFEVAGERGRAKVAQGRLKLRSSRLRYRYPLEERLRHGAGLERGAGRPGSYLLRGDRYLLVPAPAAMEPDASVELRFRGLPPRLPWPTEQVGREGEAEWVVRLRPADLRQLGFHAFGARPLPDLELPGGARWQVSALEGSLRADDEALQAWLGRAAAEVLAVSEGRANRERLSIVLVPTPSAEPAPFGRLLHSEPQSVAILVGERAEAPEFGADWLATHELMHTLHPRFEPAAPFLSEGIAAYYQCQGPIRSGRQPAAAMWGILARGVETGQVEAQGYSLREASRLMHRLPAYGAVYWGGALLALELDLELRRGSSGRVGLSEVLWRLRGRPAVSLGEFGRAVDEVAGAPLWRAVARKHLQGQALARAPVLLGALGIGPAGLDDEAPAAAWRQRLAPSPAAATPRPAANPPRRE